MTEGAVDLKIVTERLDITLAAIRELRTLPAADLTTFTGDRRNIWAADALLRRAVEALFDTARHLLAKAHGRGGLEYREVARLAIERGLVSQGAEDPSFVNIAGFRNRLTHHYDDVTPEELFSIVRTRLGDLEQLAEELRQSATRLSLRP
jgi:uncharacterized protein YutE (UPF0331/DUF86 family)